MGGVHPDAKQTIVFLGDATDRGAKTLVQLKKSGDPVDIRQAIFGMPVKSYFAVLRIKTCADLFAGVF